MSFSAKTGGGRKPRKQVKIGLETAVLGLSPGGGGTAQRGSALRRQAQLCGGWARSARGERGWEGGRKARGSSVGALIKSGSLFVIKGSVIRGWPGKKKVDLDAPQKL